MSADDAKLVAAENAHREGQLEAAERLYRELLDSPNHRADALYGTGSIALRRRDFAQARELLSTATKFAPGRPEIWFNRALAEKDLGQFAAFRSSILRALALGRGDNELQLRGLLLLTRNGFARDAYAEARHVQANTLADHFRLAEIEAANGHWHGAASRLFAVAADDRLSHRDRLQIAHSLGELRDYPRAWLVYERVPVDNWHSDDWERAARYRLQARQPGAATRWLKQAADSPTKRFLQARTAQLKGDFEAMLNHCECILATDVQHAGALRLILEHAENAKIIETAIDRAKRSLRSNTISLRDRAEIELAISQAFAKLGENQATVQYAIAGNEAHQTHLEHSGQSFALQQLINEANLIATRNDRLVEKTFCVAPDAPVFIVGMPRSGTTLVEQIIAAFGQHHAAGELESLEMVAALDNWAGASGTKVPATQLRDEYWRLSERERGPIIDKMPHNFRHIGLLADLFPSSAVILMTRDPANIIWSIYQRLFPDGHRYATKLENLANYVRYQRDLCSYWQRLLPTRILEVSLESLVGDVGSARREIAAHLGLDWPPKASLARGHNEPVFTFSELQVRQPISADAVGSWRTYHEYLPNLAQIYDETCNNRPWQALL